MENHRANHVLLSFFSFFNFGGFPLKSAQLYGFVAAGFAFRGKESSKLILLQINMVPERTHRSLEHGFGAGNRCLFHQSNETSKDVLPRDPPGVEASNGPL